MTELNFRNRTFGIMDNLPFLRSLNNECIDLIAIDPPFAANETFTSTPKIPISDEELAEERELALSHGVEHNEGVGNTRVKDVWNWDRDIHPAWMMRMKDDYPKVAEVIEAVEACASENEAAYSAFMAVRLIECRRVLKPTGSIYVHCDYHANSYLRMLMDAIFGSVNYRNEIKWCYTSAGNVKRWFPRKSDSILYYVKTQDAGFNMEEVRVPYAPGLSVGGNTAWGDKETDLTDRLNRGKLIEDYWTDISVIYRGRNKENTGYATQKPLALYERIIKASSNPGDVVMDIFAGCATTSVAAEKLGRKWIACDMAYRSWTMVKRRFYRNGFALDDMTGSTVRAMGGNNRPMQLKQSFTVGPNNLPERTDVDPLPHHILKQSKKKRSTSSASWSGRIPKDDAKKLLMDKFGPVCWGCGYEPRRPNGSIDATLLEVDHIRARKANEGVQGDDELYNLAVLHRTCNSIKLHRMTLEELRKDNVENERLYVDSASDLVDLFEAQQYAVTQIMQLQ